jgi:PAS domain S-box-containing protein
MVEISQEERLAAVNDVLRVAVRYPSLLEREAFEELCEAIRTYIPFAWMGVLLPDGPDHMRLYAQSRQTTSPVQFGGRFRQRKTIRDQVYGAGVPFWSDVGKKGSGGEIDRLVELAGYGSYLMVPVRGSSSQSGAAQKAGPYPHAPGRVGVVADLAVSFHDTTGAREAPLALLEDIAAILGSNIERAFRTARERRLAMILDTSGDAMLAWDRDGRVTDANAAAATLSGRDRDRLIGLSIYELLGPLPESFQESPPSGTRIDLVGPCPEGITPPRIPVSATITSVEDDPMVRFHALLRELTAVVKAEREAAERLRRIRELEEQHRTLLDNAPLIIFRLDPHTNELRYLNHHAERLLGVPTAEALGTPGFLRDAHADREGVTAFDQAVAEAKLGVVSLPYEARLKRRHGEEITSRGTVYPLLSEHGDVVAIEGLLADVSAEHAARTRLVQADRLSTLGTLAAGVAHEINNPAAFILLGLDMLDRLLRGPGATMEKSVADSASDLVHELRDSIKRIVDIARDLRMFAAPPPQESSRRTVVDVNRTVESALTLTRGQIIERAQLVCKLGDVPHVVMDDGRLGQVVVNLVVNAAQAIPTGARGHTVSVVTRSDGRTVQIEVTDTGVGISEENLPRIWAPFFTTKSPEVGTGLGLSISREIIERAGGSIRAESPVSAAGSPGGSRFTITLPAGADDDSVQPKSSPQLSRQPAGRARVLVVEDEAPLARALAEQLGRVHEVVIAGGAAAALEALAEGQFDVVLCDLRMPGMSGEALYAKVRAENEAVACGFIFMTGVGFGADVERFLASAGRPVLEKPFRVEDALEVIAKVIAKNRSPLSGPRSS